MRAQKDKALVRRSQDEGSAGWALRGPLASRADGPLSMMLFYAPLAVWCLSMLLFTKTSFAQFTHGIVDMVAIRYTCYAVLAIRELLYGKWYRHTIVGVIVFAVMACCTLPAKWTAVFASLVFALCGRDIPLKRHVAVIASLVSFVLLVTAVCSQIGFIPDHVLSDGGMDRHQLGFSHPNNVGALVLFIVLSVLFLRDGKPKVVELIGIIALVALAFFLTRCRTMLICTAFGLVLCVIAAKHQGCYEMGKRARVSMCALVPLIAAAALILCVVYDPQSHWMEMVDRLLSNRIGFGHKALETYGFSVFGQDAQFKGTSGYNLVTGEWVNVENPLPIDCVYVRILVQAGVFFLVAAVGLTSVAIWQSTGQRDYVLVAIIVCLAVYGLSESACLYLYWNPFFMLFGWVFRGDVQSVVDRASAVGDSA